MKTTVCYALLKLSTTNLDKLTTVISSNVTALLDMNLTLDYITVQNAAH